MERNSRRSFVSIDLGLANVGVVSWFPYERRLAFSHGSVHSEYRDRLTVGRGSRQLVDGLKLNEFDTVIIEQPFYKNKESYNIALKLHGLYNGIQSLLPGMVGSSRLSVNWWIRHTFPDLPLVTYPDRKKAAITVTDRVLAETPFLIDWLAVKSKISKADDVADAFVNLVHYLATNGLPLPCLSYMSGSPDPVPGAFANLVDVAGVALEELEQPVDQCVPMDHTKAKTTGRRKSPCRRTLKPRASSCKTRFQPARQCKARARRSQSISRPRAGSPVPQAMDVILID